MTPLSPVFPSIPQLPVCKFPQVQTAFSLPVPLSPGPQPIHTSSSPPEIPCISGADQTLRYHSSRCHLIFKQHMQTFYTIIIFDLFINTLTQILINPVHHADSAEDINCGVMVVCSEVP